LEEFKMSCSKYEIRVLLRHYWKQGHKAAAAARKICEVEGDVSLKVRTAQFWFQRFNGGNTSLEDEERSGRPTVLRLDDLRAAVEDDPATSTRKLSADLGVSHMSVARHLHQIGKVSRSCRVVPHELSNAQAQRRIDLCKQLLANPNDERFFKRIVTGDEKLIYLRNPNMQNQWVNIGQPAEPVARLGRFERKVMLCLVEYGRNNPLRAR
jgi:histone-lysine N-methyltransferase SETMAR